MASATFKWRSRRACISWARVYWPALRVAANIPRPTVWFDFTSWSWWVESLAYLSSSCLFAFDISCTFAVIITACPYHCACFRLTRCTAVVRSALFVLSTTYAYCPLEFTLRICIAERRDPTLIFSWTSLAGGSGSCALVRVTISWSTPFSTLTILSNPSSWLARCATVEAGSTLALAWTCFSCKQRYTYFSRSWEIRLNAVQIVRTKSLGILTYFICRGSLYAFSVKTFLARAFLVVRTSSSSGRIPCLTGSGARFRETAISIGTRLAIVEASGLITHTKLVSLISNEVSERIWWVRNVAVIATRAGPYFWRTTLGKALSSLSYFLVTCEAANGTQKSRSYK